MCKEKIGVMDMKNFKILGVTLSLVLIICNLMNNCVYAQSFDDEDEGEE